MKEEAFGRFVYLEVCELIRLHERNYPDKEGSAERQRLLDLKSKFEKFAPDRVDLD